MSINKYAPAATEANRNQKLLKHNNTTAAQRQRLLAALKQGGVSTIQARRDLDIMMPGARIFELRHKEGHSIQMVWVVEDTEAGNPHRVGYYVLQAKSSRNANNQSVTG
ncbi:Helix-turn-helix domain-containing protein [Nitrosomonas marina]|uniref:Helix-turn-helix domain-containing protein n=1 Tax=Nitrosomonas marina TaxID=917 RepID=A0A1I0EP43_9PROT|nr:helix-turn-helix domain-containing protein [Nitrosomonas marina]SET47071.1 Helix-turn-helix domain-containing protein [Nitrosomonas marina]